jgi:hypothetical protein
VERQGDFFNLVWKFVPPGIKPGTWEVLLRHFTTTTKTLLLLWHSCASFLDAGKLGSYIKEIRGFTSNRFYQICCHIGMFGDIYYFPLFYVVIFHMYRWIDLPYFLVISSPQTRRQQSSPASFWLERSLHSRGRLSRALRMCGSMRGGSNASGVSQDLRRRCMTCCRVCEVMLLGRVPDLPFIAVTVAGNKMPWHGICPVHFVCVKRSFFASSSCKWLGSFSNPPPQKMHCSSYSVSIFKSVENEEKTLQSVLHILFCRVSRWIQ